MVSKKSFTLLVASRTTPFFVVVPILLSRIVDLHITAKSVIFVQIASWLSNQNQIAFRKLKFNNIFSLNLLFKNRFWINCVIL